MSQFTELQDEDRGVVPARRFAVWYLVSCEHSEWQDSMWESQVLFPALPVPSGMLSEESFNKVHSVNDHKLTKINVVYSLEIVVMKIFSVMYLNNILEPVIVI